MSNDRLKFRAWDKRTKQFYPYSFAMLGEALLLGALEDWIIQQDPEGGRLARLAEVEIVQWTGLYDSEGVEIYEGDIVHIEKDRFGPGRHEVWSVEYGYFGDAAFYAQNHINSGRLLEPDLCSVSTEATFSRGGRDDVIVCKVVGNIYENSDLLG